MKLSPPRHSSRQKLSPDAALVKAARAARSATGLNASVEIGGWVKKPSQWNERQLERQGAVDLPTYLLCGAQLGVTQGTPVPPMRGVLLRKLIALAEPAFGERTDFKRTVLIAEALDGHRAIFSWPALDPATCLSDSSSALVIPHRELARCLLIKRYIVRYIAIGACHAFTCFPSDTVIAMAQRLSAQLQPGG